MCGEKDYISREELKEAGSPPRVRGKVLVLPFPSNTRRITPACAGKSSLFISVIGAYKDHPRVCGEKQGLFGFVRRRGGSPPRVRGKALYNSRLGFCAGITPACAGKSPPKHLFCLRFQDHPRVCGEKTKKVLENSELLIPCVSDFIEFLINPECGTAVLQGSVKPLRLYVKIVRQRL